MKIEEDEDEDENKENTDINANENVKTPVKIHSWQKTDLTNYISDIFNGKSACVIIASVSAIPFNVGQTYLTTVFAEKC